MPLPKEHQKQAVAFLTKEVFKRIEWFFNKEIASKYGAVTNEVNGLGISVMENLLFQ